MMKVLWLVSTTFLGTAAGTSTSRIPDDFSAAFGSYPNLFNITEQDRQSFHPVVKFPSNEVIHVHDCTSSQGLATTTQIQQARRRNRWWRVWSRRLCHTVLGRFIQRPNKKDESFHVGKYDENRVSMYTSEHFQNEENHIDGFGGLRTVHLGADLGAPVGTKVFAFDEGLVHSAGYNPEAGDYGYVLVVEHRLAQDRSIWALYGHMDKATVRRKKPGMRLRKGQVLGRIGDCHENGGWKAPHVHFQISVSSPLTHDMPGASSTDDREKALLQYPDPRYILGPIH